MIRVIFKGTGDICSEVESIEDAASVVSIAPEETEIHPDDLLAALKANAKAAVIAQADDYGSRLTSGYPAHERDSWPVKIAEAKAILSGETDLTALPVIATECRFTGISLMITAQGIMAKAIPLAMASGAISGIRQVAVQSIDLATDADMIAQALAIAKGQADAAFKSILKGH